MTNKLILFSFLWFTSHAFAQEKSYAFSMEEAISFALDSNYTALNSRRDVAMAIKKKWETTATGLPQLNGKITYNNNLKQPVTLIPGEFTGGEPGTFSPVVFGTKQNANAFATLEQLIFDGSYLVGLQAAKVFLDYTENANEKILLEVRKGVINAYGSVLIANELIEIDEKNKVTLEKNLFETRKIYESGLTELENVEQLEITLLEVETKLKNTIRMRSIARQMFNAALGIDINANVTLTQKLDELAIQNIQLNFLDRDLNLEDNIDYKIAQNLTEQRSLELKLEKSKALPNLSAFVNYGTQANSNSFTFLNGEQIWFQSSVFGVSMNIPVFSSGLRSAKTQQAKIALEQSETLFTETVQQLKLQFDAAQNNYQFSIEVYENAKKNLALAERIETKNQIKFSEGLVSSFDLRQAQTQLYAAQQSYYQSLLNVINGKAELETILNTPQLKN